MDARLPAIVQPLIEQYARQLKTALPEVVESVYIVGSIALGEFNPLYSDIDFVTVVGRELLTPELEALRHVHTEIEEIFPRWKMSGSYIRTHHLGRLDESLDAHVHYHDGKLRVQKPNELNPVTWWELKNAGVVVFGVPPQHLAVSIDRDTLLPWMMNNLNTYWASWTRRPLRVLMLYTDWGVQWAVTGVLRQYYTLREGVITTKVKAAEYALCHVPARWHPIVQEAINIRQGRRSGYRFRLARLIEAVNFLTFIIRTCNQDYIAL